MLVLQTQQHTRVARLLGAFSLEFRAELRVTPLVGTTSLRAQQP